MPKRPEITLKEFEQALDLKALAVIDFDTETFGQAANNGQMIEELNTEGEGGADVPRHRDDAGAPQGAAKAEKKSASGSLAPLLEKLKLKR